MLKTLFFDVGLIMKHNHMIYFTVQQIVGEGNGTPLQYSCLGNPMDVRAWQAVVHRVTEGQTLLSDFTFTFHFHALEKEMATHSSVLAWRTQGRRSLVGCRLWGRTESDTTEATQQQQQQHSKQYLCCNNINAIFLVEIFSFKEYST